MISFGYTILYVADVQKSLKFYQDIFDLPLKFCTPESDYAELITGTTTLALGKHSLIQAALFDDYEISAPEKKSFGIEIGFTTDDVDGLYKKALEHGALWLVEPKDVPWGQRVSYVRDPDGFLIEICTVVG